MAEMNLTDGIDLLQRRGKILQAVLVGGLLLSVAMMAGQIAELNGTISLEGEEFTPFAMLYGFTAIAYLLLLIGTYILFGMWIYRAAANVVTAQADGFEYSAGWAVGWLFIPIANLFKPYAAMRQIDNASHGRPVNALNEGDWLLRSWWAAWLVVSIAGNISFRLSLRANTPEEIRTGLEIDLFATVVSFILYPLAFLLVRRITQAQQERLNAANIFA